VSNKLIVTNYVKIGNRKLKIRTRIVNLLLRGYYLIKIIIIIIIIICL